MADNVPITAGSGTNIATDDVGGAHYQKMKLDVGGDGASTPVSGSLPVSGVAADGAAVSGNPVLVAGQDGTNVQTFKTDSIGRVEVIDGGQSLTVDGTVAVSSIAAGDNNIGNVDIIRVGTTVDANNSSTTPLAEGATFTGTATDATGYSTVSFFGFSDKEHQVFLDFSVNGTDWDYTVNGELGDSIGYLFAGADAGFQQEWPILARYLRVRVTHIDTGNATAFRFQTLLRTHPASVEVHGPHIQGGSVPAREYRPLVVRQGITPAQAIIPWSVRGHVADGSALASAPEGNPVLVAGQDGTNVQSIKTDSTGRVEVIDGGQSITVDAPADTPVAVRMSDGSGFIDESAADNAGFTDGTTRVTPVGYIFDEVAGTALTENDVAAGRIDSKRAQVLVIEDATTRGQRAAVSAAGRLSVDGSGVTQPVSGTVTANLGEGTSNIGDVDVLTVPAPLSTSGNGTAATALRVTVASDSTGTVAVTQGTAANLKTEPNGSIAHDSPDSTTNPIKIGAKAITDLAGATMVAAADRTDLYADLDGVQLSKPFVPFNNILVERITNTDGNSTALSTFGATASARNYITTIVAHNSSATDGFVDIRDGTGGSVIMTIPLPQKGGAVINLPVPLKQPTANTALAYDVSAALTTVYLTFVGFKSKA